jgi:hypothetical protein
LCSEEIRNLTLSNITDEVTLKGMSWAVFAVRMGKNCIQELEEKLDKYKPLG